MGYKNIAGYGDKELLECEKFDFEKGIWVSTKEIPISRQKFCAVSTIPGKFLILGGKYQNGTRLDTILEYDITKNDWINSSIKLPTVRSSFSACYSPSGVLYISGGSNGKILNTFYSFDLTKSASNKGWLQLENTKEKREEHGLVLGPDNNIYAIGGFDGKKCLSSAERFNPKTGHWENLPNMKTARRSLCAIAMPDGIYAIGGHNGEKSLSTIERFDMQKGEWVSAKSMIHPRCSMAAVSSLDCRYIYVLGGYDGSPTNLVERFDLLNDSWEFLPPMKNPRIMHAACVGCEGVQEFISDTL